jgi:hypothetical protein
MTFKNEAQLKKFLIEKCVKAVANTERKVHEEVAGNLNQFYTEFHPDVYERTGALFNSLESTGATQTSNGAVAEVYFNTPSYNTGTWSGETVLDVAMKSGVPHGGWAEGTAIWTESMEKLGGRQGIKSLLKQELKKQGV